MSHIDWWSFKPSNIFILLPETYGAKQVIAM
jgi:hypothetical protein